MTRPVFVMRLMIVDAGQNFYHNRRMWLAVIGLNHKTAPVEIRERLACDADRTQEVLASLKAAFPVAEFALLATCNRVELYCAAKRTLAPLWDDIVGQLAVLRKVSREQFQPCLYVHEDEVAVQHLLRVSASLDSMVVGEPQIIAQVKDAYRLACQAGSAGKVLNRLFHSAFATSKEIYTHTGIACRRVSVAGVAVELARKHCPELQPATIVVVGTGEMSELLVKHFQQWGCGDITVISRSCARAEGMAQRLTVQAGDWSALNANVLRADIIVAAATAQKHLFTRAALESLLRQRQGRGLLVIDIAVPRNFDPAINVLPGVQLYSVDDLAQIAHENHLARREELDQAETMVARSVGEFMEWLAVMELGPRIGQLQEKIRPMPRETLIELIGACAWLSAEVKHAWIEQSGQDTAKIAHELIDHIRTHARSHGVETTLDLIDEWL